MNGFGLPTVVLLCFAAAAGCGSAPSVSSRPVLRVAVTTTTRDSGLLDEIVPLFEKERNVRVDVIAVATGKAIKLGENGDVDVVWVHSRQDEDAFMQAGHGVRREDVMYNTFQILGPPDDPAGIRDLEPAEALQRIAQAKVKFVSRGDDSGTHQRELALWKSIGGRPEWDGYVESGQGMGPTLIMADQMRACVMSDRGTYLSFLKKIDLVPLAKTTDVLFNPYGIMVVNPDKNAQMKPELANEFVDFIISPRVQKLIRDYRINGEQLFHPLRLEADSDSPGVD